MVVLGMACLLGTAAARAQMPSQGAGDAGQRLYKENCASCHKWDGSGGGGYGGAAASLRAMKLDRAQITNIASCGIPGSGMPYNLSDAYTKAHPCYGQTSTTALGKDAPLQPHNFLHPPEIHAVVSYVLANLKGRGATTFAECQAFFGTHTRACDDYRKAAGKHEP